jgi:UDP-N-acetylglucosamine 2-epimerase (hydrolysing)
MKKKILFITGTRADFGKLKPLIQAVHDDSDFDYLIFSTGMHMLSKYGNTSIEIQRSGFNNLFMFINQMEGESMEIILANTIIGLTRYLYEHRVDMIVIHGDRIEALAGAITGALRNILVAHVEGGEISGTIDDLIRHSTSKLSHIHFVASDVAEKRLQQLGENDNTIFKIGSPDIDIMLSDLPSIREVKDHYEIKFSTYAIALLHPVTTEIDQLYKHASIFVESLIKSGKNYVIIYPNNDIGSEHIFRAYNEELEDNERIKLFPSLRFEYFLALLKHADFIVGNSSAGIHEAPVYGVPTINIGTRQSNRFQYESILNVDYDINEILEAIATAFEIKRFTPCDHYGDGSSAEKFMNVMRSKELWQISQQKKFKDLNIQNVPC